MVSNTKELISLDERVQKLERELQLLRGDDRIQDLTLQRRLARVHSVLKPVLEKVRARKRENSIKSLAEFNNFQYWRHHLYPIPKLDEELLNGFLSLENKVEHVEITDLKNHIELCEKIKNYTDEHKEWELLHSASPVQKNNEEQTINTDSCTQITENESNFVQNKETAAQVDFPEFVSATHATGHHHTNDACFVRMPTPEIIHSLGIPSANLSQEPNRQLQLIQGGHQNYQPFYSYQPYHSTSAELPQAINFDAGTVNSNFYYPVISRPQLEQPVIIASQPIVHVIHAPMIGPSPIHSNQSSPIKSHSTTANYPIRSPKPLPKLTKKIINTNPQEEMTFHSSDSNNSMTDQKKIAKLSAPATTEAMQQDSSVTLSPHPSSPESVSLEQILGEDEKPSVFNLTEFVSPTQNNQTIVAESSSESSRQFTVFFRYFNLIRAVATSSYAIYQNVEGIKNPKLRRIGATNLFISSIFFVLVDILIAFVQCFPKTLWVFWDISNWDPFKKSWSVWSLIADHEVITDIFPLVINVVLNVYSYRLSELLADPRASSSILDIPNIDAIDDFLKPKQQNFILLMVFLATMVYTFLFHAIRLGTTLIKQKKAISLSLLIVLKSLMLTFDLVTQGFFLYETLVHQQRRLFSNDPVLKLILSVVVPSFIVTLTTNSLVNVPLHYSFLRMQIMDKIDSSTGLVGKNVPKLRLFFAAMRRAFHPFISIILGSYSVYSLVAQCWILKEIRKVDIIETDGSFSVSLPSNLFGGKGDVLLIMVILNLIINYFTGLVSCGLFWIYILFSPLTGHVQSRGKMRKYFK